MIYIEDMIYVGCLTLMRFAAAGDISALSVLSAQSDPHQPGHEL